MDLEELKGNANSRNKKLSNFKWFKSMQGILRIQYLKNKIKPLSERISANNTLKI